MKIICPKCGRLNKVSPAKILGSYILCTFCKTLFSWKKNNIAGNKNE